MSSDTNIQTKVKRGVMGQVGTGLGTLSVASVAWLYTNFVSKEDYKADMMELRQQIKEEHAERHLEEKELREKIAVLQGRVFGGFE